MFWVCRLSPAWQNVHCSQFMPQFDSFWLQVVYLTVERRPARNLQHENLQTNFDMFDQSQHLLHTLHKSFLCFSCVFTFLKIIRHNMPKKPIYFLPTSILKWLHKYSPILITFFKCMLIWLLSQYNLTKLFWVKFKTTKLMDNPILALMVISFDMHKF